MKGADEFFEALVRAAADEAEKRVLARLEKVQVTDRTLSEKEAALYLGISIETVRNMRRRNEIQYTPVGKKDSKRPRIIYQKSALDAWLRKDRAI